MMSAAKEVSFIIRSILVFFLLLILLKNIPTEFGIKHSFYQGYKEAININVESELQLSNKGYDTLTVEHKNKGY